MGFNTWQFKIRIVVDVQAFMKWSFVREEQKSAPFQLTQVANVDFSKSARFELNLVGLGMRFGNVLNNSISLGCNHLIHFWLDLIQ